MISLGTVRKEALKKLKPKKELGPDCIPPYIHKACESLLVKPMTHICNVVVQTAKYPRTWTIAKIIPIPKCEIINDVVNHRFIELYNPYSPQFSKYTKTEAY